MILSKQTFSAIWNAFAEQQRENNEEQSSPEITNGVSDRLADLLTSCANGDDTCFADDIPQIS